MSSPDQRGRIFTLPNLLSTLRLLLIPVYVSLYQHAQSPADFWLAGGILIFSCCTDFADGQIARRFHMVSTLGRILDPIADKATQLTLTYFLSLRYPALRIVLVILIFKESFQLIAGILALWHGKMLSGALITGKLATTVLFVSMIFLVLFPGIPDDIIEIMKDLNIFFLGMSFVGYLWAYSASGKMLKDLHKK